MSISNGNFDSEMGMVVRRKLIDTGLETPTINVKEHDIDVDKVVKCFKKIHKLVGLDTEDDSVHDTPRRLAKTLIKETTLGMRYENFPKMTVVENNDVYGESVIVNDILVVSMCEHHWERIIMRVSIAYVPNEKILGLSKLARLAEFFGARPIIQERYTNQLAETLELILGVDDVAVHVRGIHMCMLARGVKSTCSTTTTKAFGGVFLDDAQQRSEFMSSIDLTKPILPV